jgi:hypothetical protein
MPAMPMDVLYSALCDLDCSEQSSRRFCLFWRSISFSSILVTNLQFRSGRSFFFVYRFSCRGVVTATRVREQSLGVSTRMQTAQFMFDFSRKLSGAAKLDDVLWAAAVHAQKAPDAQCVVLLRPNDGELNVCAAWPP